MYSGYLMMAYYWALQASQASSLLACGNGSESAEFYTAKIQTAEFYFERLLPRANAHRVAALAPTSAIMQMKLDNFQLA
jgi:hypothetical protein